jgi:hypothetical protein
LDNLRKRGTVPMNFLKRTFKDEIEEELDAIELARKKLKTMVQDINNIQELFVDEEEEEKTEEKSCQEKPEETPKTVEETETKIKDECVEVPAEPSESINLICEEALEPESASKITTEEMTTIDAELRNLDSKTIRLLAYQRLQQILNENPEFVKNYQDKKFASRTVEDLARKEEISKKTIPLPSQLLTKEDIEKITRSLSSSETVEMDLQNQRRFGGQRAYDLRQKPFNQRSDEEKAQIIALSLEKPIAQSKVRARAVFTPVNDYLSGEVWFTASPDLKKSVKMRYRNFEIGKGPGCDLNLGFYGKCAYISDKHATVFFDEVRT